MDNSGTAGRSLRVRVVADVIFEIADADAVERAALAKIDSLDFADPDDPSAESAESARRTERADVVSGPDRALLMLVEPHGMLPPNLPGCDEQEAAVSAELVNSVGHDAAGTFLPDFQSIFSTCACGDDSCAECGGLQLTPRTAALLWSKAQLLADSAYDDVATHGDDPVKDDAYWNVFDRYPPLTFRQNAVWRRQCARAFDDLSNDLERGDLPTPTCAGEEMALHLMLEDAKAEADDGFLNNQDVLDLPAQPPGERQGL